MNVLSEVQKVLENINLPYALIGAHAVNTWLEPRFTANIDIVLAISQQDIEGLKRKLYAAGYTADQEYGKELSSGPDFLRFCEKTKKIILEIQSAKTDFQRGIIERSVTDKLGLRVATAEDLIVMKLIAFRNKDRIDLEGLMQIEGLDYDHITKWAKAWDVLDRFEALKTMR